MAAKFSFYEVVEINPERPDLKEIEGLRGVVLGMVENEQGNWVYAVHMLSTEESWDVLESELISVGEFMTREDFYDGGSAKVEVDPETGEARLGG